MMGVVGSKLKFDWFQTLHNNNFQQHVTEWANGHNILATMLCLSAEGFIVLYRDALLIIQGIT